MKRFFLTARVGLAVAAMALPAVAADLGPPSYKAEPIYTPPFSWTGFYVGINGGYGWSSSRSTETIIGVSTGDFDVSGGMAGGTMGYNLQTGLWVWGLEGDIDASWMKGTSGLCGGAGCTTENTWFATARGRIGFVCDRFLPYITGGAAFGDIKMTPPVGPFSTATQFGWTVGAGIEYAFMGPVSAKLEYLYADLGTASCGSPGCGNEVNVTLNNINILRLGVNYRF